MVEYSYWKTLGHEFKSEKCIIVSPKMNVSKAAIQYKKLVMPDVFNDLKITLLLSEIARFCYVFIDISQVVRNREIARILIGAVVEFRDLSIKMFFI